MDPKLAKLVNLPKICTCRPLIRPIIHQRDVLEAPESPKSPNKIVLPENVSTRAFYMAILDEIDLKVAKLVNLAQIWTCRTIIRPINHQRDMLEDP